MLIKYFYFKYIKYNIDKLKKSNKYFCYGCHEYHEELENESEICINCYKFSCKLFMNEYEKINKIKKCFICQSYINMKDKYDFNKYIKNINITLYLFTNLYILTYRYRNYPLDILCISYSGVLLCNKSINYQIVDFIYDFEKKINYSSSFYFFSYFSYLLYRIYVNGYYFQ